jgi:hypothetical protein
MSRLSVAGTDEAGDTVKVEPEETNQNTLECVYTYISYIIYCIVSRLSVAGKLALLGNTGKIPKLV